MTHRMERHHLLGRLHSTWAESADGAVSMTVVCGDPGIGKSSLLRELRSRIGDRARLVRGSGRSDDRALRIAAEAAAPHRLNRTLDPLKAADAIARSWARQSRSSPLALLLDDVHDFDPASRIALGVALRRFDGQSLLVVATGRPTLELFRFAEGFDLVELAGLSDVDARRLLSQSASSDIDESVMARLVALADGNPLALRSLPKALTADQLAAKQPLPDPMVVLGDLRSLLTRPLADVTSTARELLELAMLSIDGDWKVIREASRENAVALTELERAGLITLGEGTIEPFHPLLREAVRGELPDHRRRELAERLARVGDLDATHRLVYRALAVTGSDASLARELTSAAELALRKRAVDAAAALFARAADVSAPGSEGAAVRLRAAEALAFAGESAQARVRLVSIVDDETVELTVDHYVRVQTLLAALESVGGEAARARTRLEGLREQVPSSFRASILAAMSIPLGMMGDVPALLETTQQALASSPSSSGEEGALRVVRAHALSAVDEGAGAELLTDVLASIDMRAAVRADPLFGLHLGRSFGYAERYSEGARVMMAIIAGARRLGARTTLAMAHGALADIRLRSSRLDESVVQLDEAIAISLGAGQRAFAPFWLGMRARIAGLRGEFDAAQADLALGYEIADDVGGEGARYYLDAHAGVVAATGQEWARAAEHLERARAFERAVGGLTPIVARWSIELVDAYRALGETRALRGLVDDLERAAQRPGARRWTRATAVLASAIASCDEDPHHAASRAQTAANIFARDDDRLDWVRSRTLHVMALHATGATAEVTRPLAAEARHGLAALRLRPWANRLERHLTTAPGARLIDTPRTTPLTTTELRVLEEVARGLANQQIAVKLGVSTKTIANHLYRIYGKLGVSSRTEAARRHLLGE